MSETRRTVSVEIVYDGNDCGHDEYVGGRDCPFLVIECTGDVECSRFRKTINNFNRCDECKAEDPRTITVEEFKAMLKPGQLETIIAELKASGCT
jgi:hypothetical protein